MTGDAVATRHYIKFNDPRARTSRRAVQFTLALFPIIASICPAEDVDERWLLREYPGVVIDGNDTDWNKCDYAIHGVNTVRERSGIVTIGRGWTFEGLVCAVRILTDATYRDANVIVDIFADLRPPTANMASYEEGVAHIILDVNSPDVVAKIKYGAGEELSLEVGSQIRVEVVRNYDGLFLEALIPWSTVRGSKPHLEDWIGFGIRTKFSADPAIQLVFGADTEESSNPIETTPIAFTPLKLTGPRESMHPQISVEAAEVVLGKEPWLEIVVAAPKSLVDLAGGKLEVDSAVLGRFEEPFGSSAGGRCWLSAVKLVLPLRFTTDPTIRLTVTSRTGTIAWRETIAIPALRRLLVIEQTLPEELFETLPVQQRSLGLMLKGCARECALLQSPNVNDGRSSRKRARGIVFPGIYEERINRFERMAIRIAQDEDFARNFPYRAWQSQIDGQWLPYKLIQPWQSGVKAITQLTLYGAATHHSRAEMIESDVIAIDAGAIPARYGDRNYVVLYKRAGGGAGMDREALDYFFEQIVPSLGKQDMVLGIEGVSAGATNALQIALDRPDKFSYVRLISGPIPESALALITNLRGVNVSLFVGELDTKVAQSNRVFADALESIKATYEYRVLQKTGHHFYPPGRSPGQTPVPRQSPPRHVSLIAFTPDAGARDWLQLEQILSWGQPASVDGQIVGSRIELKAVNAISVKIRPRLIPDLPSDWVVVINGKVAGQISRSENADATFYLGPGGYRRITDVQNLPLRKVAGQSGPARQIDGRPVTIIYGTIDAMFSPVLRHRAVEILRDHLGFGPRQIDSSGYTILSDREALGRNLQGQNIWLIGNQEQNDYVSHLYRANRLPERLRSLSSDSDSLVSYIFPIRGESEGYLYHEMGTTPLAYCAPVLAAPNHDICIQSVVSGSTAIKQLYNFDTLWSF